MAAEGIDTIMTDLQMHLRTANLELSNLSSIAKNGDEQLVEKFLSETVFVRVDGQHQLAQNKLEVLQSQLYVACFWGFKDVVKGILRMCKDQAIPVEVNYQNPGSLWTPLHAATFQEHGPIIMELLEHGADPCLEDSDGRTPVDFASASVKVWGHFGALNYKKTPRPTLVDMGIIKKTDDLNAGDPLTPRGGNASPREPGKGIRMASYDAVGSEDGPDSDPFIHASVTGDVLANAGDTRNTGPSGPQFSVYK